MRRTACVVSGIAAFVDSYTWAADSLPGPARERAPALPHRAKAGHAVARAADGEERHSWRAPPTTNRGSTGRASNTPVAMRAIDAAVAAPTPTSAHVAHDGQPAYGPCP